MSTKLINHTNTFSLKFLRYVLKSGKKHARPSQASKPKKTKAKTPKKTAKTKPSKELKKKAVKKKAKPVAAVVGLARQDTLPTASAPTPGPSKPLKKSPSKKPSTLSRTASRSTASGFYVPPKEEWPIQMVNLNILQISEI